MDNSVDHREKMMLRHQKYEEMGELSRERQIPLVQNSFHQKFKCSSYVVPTPSSLAYPSPFVDLFFRGASSKHTRFTLSWNRKKRCWWDSSLQFPQRSPPCISSVHGWPRCNVGPGSALLCAQFRILLIRVCSRRAWVTPLWTMKNEKGTESQWR